MKRFKTIIVMLTMVLGLAGCDKEEIRVYNEYKQDKLIDSIEVDLNEDYIVDKIELVHDEDDVILKINKSQIVIEDSFNESEDRVSIKDKFELDEITGTNKNYIGVTRWQGSRENRSLNYLYIYEYKDGEIIRSINLSPKDYELNIAKVSLVNKSYIFELKNLHEAYKKRIDQMQINYIKDKYATEGIINKKSYDEINKSFSNTISNILYKDFNNDGNDEIILVSDMNVTNENRAFIDEKVFFINTIARNRMRSTKFISQSDIIKDSFLGKYYLTDRLMKIREEIYYNMSKTNKYRVDFYSKSDGKDNDLFDEFIIYKVTDEGISEIFDSRNIKEDYRRSGLFISAINFNDFFKINDYDNDGIDEFSIPILDMANYQYQLILDDNGDIWDDVFLGWVEDDIIFDDVNQDGSMELITDTLSGGSYASWWIGLKQVNTLTGDKYKYSEELTKQYLLNAVSKAQQVFYKEKSTETFVNLLNAYAVLGKTDECKETINYYTSITKGRELDYTPYNDTDFENFFNLILYRSELYRTQIWNN